MVLMKPAFLMNSFIFLILRLYIFVYKKKEQSCTIMRIVGFNGREIKVKWIPLSRQFFIKPKHHFL